jgi:hypothetical protein
MKLDMYIMQLGAHLYFIFVRFWRWCISIKRIVFMDLKTETEPVSETLCRCLLYVLGLCAIVCVFS